jgi:hypothetical protein
MTTAKHSRPVEPGSANPPNSPDASSFDWPLAFTAEQYLRDQIDRFLRRNQFARQLAARMRDETATDFFEWIDHLVLDAREEEAVVRAGFTLASAETPRGEKVYEHARATLPRVLLGAGEAFTIALRPEHVADFIERNGIKSEPDGEPLSRFRRVVVSEENGARLEAVERHGYRGFVAAPLPPASLAAIIKARELWHTRWRTSADDHDAFKEANRILDRTLQSVGRDLSCEFFFEAERAYWERRNRAARIQKFRQDQLGLGWGNHDHHTFRCSREHFVDLIQFLQRLGFSKRERYYAGAEAGWGAQICEQPVTGIVVFADVDLMPEETRIDFSTQKLPPASRLGTVGLWVGLHGESFLQAGMHHLEARFDFDLLRDQLKGQGVTTMKPFSDFEFLRQAFTEGERWPVQPARAQSLLARGLITQAQLDQFVREGAIGSHLENLQRHGGFKGFNQKSVSVVIAATDPRKEHFAKIPVAA